ncbi:MAG: TerB family tellurite resistance protein [Lewinellaceae bacterium]|nr:TerB family tellurite resistance protein [Lewinellaceae bacterium]
MASNTENWTYDEFHAFTMLYAANVDGNITAEEKALIKPTLTEEGYEKIKAIFDACSDSVAEDIILSYRSKYFSTQAEKDKILADMLEIYKADNSFDMVEQVIHHIFSKTL